MAYNSFGSRKPDNDKRDLKGFIGGKRPEFIDVDNAVVRNPIPPNDQAFRSVFNYNMVGQRNPNGQIGIQPYFASQYGVRSDSPQVGPNRFAPNPLKEDQ